MKLGLLVRADDTGLGYQTRAYYKHLKPDKTLLVDIQKMNGNVQRYEWYENPIISRGFPNREILMQFLDGLDVVLTAETPYNFDLYILAKQKGIRVICVENPEFYDHIKYPELPMPTDIILPSVWLQGEVTAHATSKGVRVHQIHHPVDREEYPFRLRTVGKPMHIAGKPAVNDRNGTWDFMQAVPDGIVTTQSDDLAYNIRRRYRHCNVYTKVTSEQLYNLGDILVLPRKYGGNCLPLNEALSSGMPVIMPDIEPNNNLLPKEWLVPATVTDYFTPRTRVDIYSADIDALRERIEYVRANIQQESERADQIADSISWETLLPKWQEVIHGK